MIRKLTHLKAISVGLFAALMFISGAAHAKSEKPNILVIWGDDIGITNISAYSDGIMGYETPNIDRLANEGALFTNAFCTNSICSPSRGRPSR